MADPPSRSLILMPVPVPSLEPNESTSFMFLCTSRASFAGWLQITPDDMIMNTDDRS